MAGTSASTRRAAAEHEPAVEDTRERILRIAAEMFAEYGFHGTSVAQLGDAVGLQRGALYYHIRSKEDVLYDLSKRHVEEALARGRVVVESDLPPAEKFRALAREHLASLTARQDEVTVVVREMHALTGERAEALKALRGEVEGLFLTVLAEGKKAGVFGPNDIITAHGILGMLNSTHVWFSHKTGHLTATQVADRLSTIILDGLVVR